MKVNLSEAPITQVALLAQIPIAFRVERICEVDAALKLSERAIEPAYIKDYDALAGEGPTQWARNFDLAHWGFIRAEADSRFVGGVVIASRTPGINLLESRDDLAVIWDIRVAPEVRGLGMGSALLVAADRWTGSRGCTELKVETQNINVAACRLYARHGFTLRAAHRDAYPDLPGEIQLLWSKTLPSVEIPNGAATPPSRTDPAR